MNNWPDSAPPVDPAAETQPVRRVNPYAQTQEVKLDDRLEVTQPSITRPPRKPKRELRLKEVLLTFTILALFYFFLPFRTNILILGIDRAPGNSAVGRSDTLILMTVNPLLPTLAGFSIPRDLWVPIPGYGENRINTAHYFAEAAQEGQGPYTAMQTIEQNFGLRVPYYVRLRFSAFKQFVDALGGVDIQLDSSMAGYPAGSYHLDADQALAFVRDRSGTDDFFRMAQAQVMLRAVIQQVLNPLNWPRLPGATWSALSAVDTNLPVWLLPRLLFSMSLSSLVGIDMESLNRDMVQPYQTSEGALVLLPVWERINPTVDEIFGW